MRILSLLIIIISTVYLARVASAADVLLLGDTEAEGQVQTALQNAGHNVTFGGIYYDWDGVTPAPSSFDVIIVLDGEDYGYPLTSGALTALQGFVTEGCGLVFTEWTAWDVYFGYKGSVIGQLMPVASDGDYGTGATWAVTNPAHPLTAGLPASWSDGAEWSDLVTVKPGTAVVIEDASSGNPLLSYSSALGGTVVHVNHDMTYTTDIMEPNALQIMVNAAEFASGCRAPAIIPTTQVPTINQWGMMVFMLLAGLGSIYYLRRRRIEN